MKAKNQKTKNYLLQVVKSKRIIEFYRDRIEELEHQATGVRAITYDGDRVQISFSDSMPDYIARIMDARTKYADAVIKHHEIVQTITEQVNSLDNPKHAQILKIRYLDINERTGRVKSFVEMGRVMGVSPERLKHMHGDALEAFRKKYLVQ